MTHFIFDGRTSTIDHRAAESDQREWFNSYAHTNMRWIVLYIWHFMTNQPQTIKMRFYFYWPGPFYVSSSDIHTYSFSFFSLYLCLLSSVRFGSVWCCVVCALFLFYFVFVLNLRLQLVFNEKFHRLFSSWNVQIVDAWWLIRNCAASDKKSRTAGSGAFAVLILTHLFDIYVLAKRLRSRDRLGYELEVMNHIVE